MAAFVRGTMEGWKSYFADPAPANALIKKDNPNMTDEQLTYSVAKLKEMGIVVSGGAATNGIGSIDEARIRQSYDFLVSNQLIDPAKVNTAQAYDISIIQSIKVLP